LAAATTGLSARDNLATPSSPISAFSCSANATGSLAATKATITGTPLGVLGIAAKATLPLSSRPFCTPKVSFAVPSTSKGGTFRRRANARILSFVSPTRLITTTPKALSGTSLRTSSAAANAAVKTTRAPQQIPRKQDLDQIVDMAKPPYLFLTLPVFAVDAAILGAFYTITAPI